jgi:hypothetical protein
VISIASPTQNTKFSKVSALVCVLHQVTIESTFEHVLRMCVPANGPMSVAAGPLFIDSGIACQHDLEVILEAVDVHVKLHGRGLVTPVCIAEQPRRQRNCISTEGTERERERERIKHKHGRQERLTACAAACTHAHIQGVWRTMARH